MFIRSADRPRRGLTLVEVMVAAFLGALVLHVIVNLLIPALRLSALGTTRVDLDGRASLAEARLVKALRATCHAGARTYPWNAAETRFLSTHPIEGTLTDSLQKFSEHLVIFGWQDKKLTQWQLALEDPPPSTPVTLSLEDLEPALAGAQSVFSIENVAGFHVAVSPGARVDFSFTLEKGTEKLKVQRSVYLVNSSQ